MTEISEISFLLPEIILALGAMLLLGIGVFGKNDRLHLVSYGAVACLVLAIGALFFVPDTNATGLGGSVVADAFATSGRLFIFFGGIVTLLLSIQYLDTERIGKFEYPILILLSTAGMGLMVSAHDLIAVYMGIELQSLGLYVLAAFNRESERSTEAGLKYFVLGALSSGLLLYGLSLVYGSTGHIDFEGVSAAVAADPDDIGLVFGMVFVLAGLAFKISAAPFHMWTPDVYEGAPTPVTAFFAATPKVAGMLLVTRVLFEAFPGVIEDWQPIVWLLSALSMAIGAISAIVQTNIKRLMAYSSIGHVGYALMGVAAGTQSGVEAVVLYLGIYLITVFGAFACILSMRRSEGMAENISDLSGLMQTRPGLGLVFTLVFLSLAGIPPLLGFFGKFAVFAAAIGSGLFVLTIVGVVTSVIALVYYLSIIRTIWFAEPETAFVSDRGSAVAISASVSGALVAVGLIVLLRPLFAVAETAAGSLFGVS